MRFVCKRCGEGFERKPSHAPDYCSKRCYGQARKRRIDDPFRFTDKNGYVRLKYWDDDREKYVHIFEHRFVWQQTNGPVPPGFVVHHENEDKSDNRLSNLRLMRRADHTREHSIQPDKYPNGGSHAEYCRRWRASRKISE